MASMRNWLEREDGAEAAGGLRVQGHGEGEKVEKGKRVVVVHCKAGKGRSGSMAISYLITHEGWKKEDAMQRFTERRMRPGFGAGISIPSQKRWLEYVDRWANKGGRMYLERSVEVTEVHVWGLREGTKIQIEGYVLDGRKIQRFHTFRGDERDDLERQVTSGASNGGSTSKLPDADPTQPVSASSPHSIPATSTAAPQSTSEVRTNTIFRPRQRIILPTSDINLAVEQRKGWGNTVTSVAHVWFNCYFEGNGPENWESQHTVASKDELKRVDTHGLDATGNPISHGHPKPNDSGVFSIDFDAMDGIKGSSRKGTRAFDRVAVVWKAVQPADSAATTTSVEDSSSQPQVSAVERDAGPKELPNLVIPEPDPGESVTPLRGADWRGSSPIIAGVEKDHGENEQAKDPMEASDDEDGAGGVRRGLVD